MSDNTNDIPVGAFDALAAHADDSDDSVQHDNESLSDAEPAQDLQSAYNYATACTFSALKSPHVRDVIVLLVKHPDFISFKDVINTLLEDKGQFLLSDNLWNPFAVDIVENIKSSLTNLKSKLRVVCQ